MAGEDLDAVRKLEQPAERVEEPFRALFRGHCEVRAGGVADEERVAGEHEPGLVGACAINDREARVLGPVPRRVNRAQDDLAELQLQTVFEQVVWILGRCCGVDRHRDAVLEREPAVAGQVIGVRVGLDHPHDLHLALGGRLQHRFDRERWIDDRSDACILVAHQIRRTAEVVVQKLLEQHEMSRYHSVRRRARREQRRARAPARAACRRHDGPGNEDASGAGTTVRLFFTSTASPPAYNARRINGTCPGAALARIRTLQTVSDPFVP